MALPFCAATLSLTSVILLAACTVSVGKDAGSNPAPSPAPPSPAEQAARDNKSGPDLVVWASVPSDFDPEIKTTTFSVVGIQKVNLDIFSSGNVQVVYVPGLDPAAATMKSFTVLKNSGSFGSLDENSKGSALSIRSTGQYTCAIEVSNGAITKLDGLCVVHTEIDLPDTAQVEVYYGDKLVGRRFYPVDNDTFLKNVDGAIAASDKAQAIDDYLTSYTQTQKTPSLTSQQLGKVVKEFSSKDDKISALKKLQSFVSDRDGLEAMIEDAFMYFDQNDARQVVGLPQR